MNKTFYRWMGDGGSQGRAPVPQNNVKKNLFPHFRNNKPTQLVTIRNNRRERWPSVHSYLRLQFLFLLVGGGGKPRDGQKGKEGVKGRTLYGGGGTWQV